MIYVAWRMLTGDRAKYLSLVIGLAFSVLLMTQQGSIFTGIMMRTFAMVTDVSAARIWVMDPGVQYPDDLKPMKDSDLSRVRDVPGVDWAVPLFKSNGRARTADGNFQTVFVFGLDSSTLLGGPREFVSGKLTDLWTPDSVLVDEAGARRLNVKKGDILELNDRRAYVAGICKATPTFTSFPIIYTTYTRAVKYVPGDRRVLTFVLCSPKDGLSDAELSARISKATGLAAITKDQFIERTLRYYAKNTGIVINFGMTTLLGFVVGLAISMQTLNAFVLDNIRHFGTLKAMGATNFTIAKMVLFQAVVVGLLGYGVGVGATALFGNTAAKNSPQLAFKFTPELMLIAFCAMTLLVAIASVLSIRRVVKLEPAIVFRGS
ncbi:MAG: ABC transporter permease [Planctomycetes bacterium]|nr:ABC transporter permease [Planctomycetota bacterium]